jgi:type IV pilus assembly protein PilO
MAISADTLLKLPTTKKALLLVVILLLITGLYVYSVYLPAREELIALEDKLNKSAAVLNKSKAVTKDLETFKKQIGALNEELKDALKQLPNEREIPEILKNISSLGKESNLEFILFKPKPEDPQQFYAKVPIELTVLGTYHNTGAFFDKISKLSRIINVVDFTMTRAKEAKGTDVLVKTSCLANTYRFIEKKSEEKKSERKSEKK